MQCLETCITLAMLDFGRLGAPISSDSVYARSHFVVRDDADILSHKLRARCMAYNNGKSIVDVDDDRSLEFTRNMTGAAADAERRRAAREPQQYLV